MTALWPRLAMVRTLAIASVMALTACGCADLGAIREYSQSSANLANTSSVIDEMPASVARRFPVNEQQAKWSQARHRDYNAAAVRDTLNRALSEAASDKDKADKVRDVLVAYMEVLGQLADDDLAKVDAQTDAMADALSKGNYISESDVDAVKSVSSILGNAALSGWQRAELASLITKCNPSVQRIVDALKRTTEQGVIGNLGEEQSQRNAFYDLMIQLNDNPEVRWLLETRRAEMVKDIKQRKDNAQKYIDALTDVGSGHAALNADARNLTSKELLARVREYAKQIQKLHSSLKKLVD